MPGLGKATVTTMDVDADASDSGGLSFIICRDEV